MGLQRVGHDSATFIFTFRQQFLTILEVLVSFVAQLVKNPPAMQETWVWFLGWEDPLEKGKAIHSVFWPGEFHGLFST